MKLMVNGKQEEIPNSTISITDLLRIKRVDMPDMVSVEYNGKILEREQFPTVIVKENDRVEFLYFMGGGTR